MTNDVILKFHKPSGETFTIESSGDWRFLKNGIVGFGLANGNLSYVDYIMGDGGEIKNVRLAKADRTVKAAYIKPQNNAIARRNFLKFFTPRVYYKIYMTYMNQTRWAEGVLYKLQMSETLDDSLLLTATMTFAFADPLWKSVDDFGRDIASVTPNHGWPWLCPIDQTVPVGTFNFERKVTLANDGDVAVYPRVIMIANDYVENPIFQINDAKVKINDILEAGDEITMDLGALPPRIEKNGDNFFGHADKKSEFTKMMLEVGSNTISFDADNGSDNLSVTVFYNKMYTVI